MIDETRLRDIVAEEVRENIWHGFSSVNEETMRKFWEVGVQTLSENDSAPKAVRHFWETGLLVISESGSRGAQQWLGRRILNAMLLGVALFAVGLLVKHGGFKL
jgi:hypothetical protein